MKKYTLTDEHRAQIPAWRDRWIANAMRTRPMDDTDRAAMRVAIRGLYEAAGLTPPPDHRIVFVPSPFVARFAGGIAAAIWWRRSHSSTAATHDATYAAIRAAADVATHDATDEATTAATYAATDEATDAIDDDVHWWRVPHMASIVAFARRVTGGELGVLCAQWAWRMSQGGNQWSAWVAFLSFFRHVAQLPLDYSKWDHWERAAIHGGLRIMHRDFCIVSDFPETLLVDAENRPHCDTGPFCRWRDGSALYAVHGVRVPAWLVEHPERLTADHITRESNAEVRRVMLERYGADRYIRDIGAVALDASDFGTLYQVPLGDDEPLTMVRVTNSTPEPDGSYKDYWLRVHPELRPMRRGEYVGHAQAMTALNAVASTFGLTGREYVLSFQS